MSGRLVLIRHRATRDSISHLPQHIAIIMDGNGRWARKRGLPRLEGHRVGVDNVRPIVECADEYGIKYLTLFGFSTENWNRPREEVNGLLALLQARIDGEAQELHRKNVRIRHLGRMEELPVPIQISLKKAIKLTRDNQGLTLNFAFNYGGRTEILDAVRGVMASGIAPEKLDERAFSQYLYSAELPDVDLVIRTSGELRLSNFMVWQAAYSEYYFTDVLWPDFDAVELKKALVSYSQRKRRFGGLGS